MKRIIVAVYVILFLFYGRAFGGAGSGAYRLEVPDAAAMGKGSAFVAQADNPSAVYYNPAGLVQLKDSRFYASVGTTEIQPFTTYKDNSGNETDMRDQIFTVPHAYVVSDFGLKKFAFGAGMTSNWGLGTYWHGDSFSRYVATRSVLTMENGYLTGAYEVNDKFSLGLSLDYTRAEADKSKKLAQTDGLGNPTADADFRLTGKDNNGWGYRVSGLYKLNKNHQFGLMYRSLTKLKYAGTVYLKNMNDPTYLALLGGPNYTTDFTSVSTLPQSVIFGYCFKPNEKWTFETDVEWMDWASVKDEKLEYPDLAPGDPARLILDGGNPVSRNWHAVFSYSFGTEYKVNDQWRLRVGYFFHQTPIPQGTLDTALPDSSVNSLTLGTGYSLTKNLTLDFAYAAMFYNERKVNNSVGSASGANINGKYNQLINLYLITITCKL